MLRPCPDCSRLVFLRGVCPHCGAPSPQTSAETLVASVALTIMVSGCYGTGETDWDGYTAGTVGTADPTVTAEDTSTGEEPQDPTCVTSGGPHDTDPTSRGDTSTSSGGLVDTDGVETDSAASSSTSSDASSSGGTDDGTTGEDETTSGAETMTDSDTTSTTTGGDTTSTTTGGDTTSTTTGGDTTSSTGAGGDTTTGTTSTSG